MKPELEYPQRGVGVKIEKAKEWDQLGSGAWSEGGKKYLDKENRIIS